MTHSIHVMVNEQGQANYNIYVSDSTVKTNTSQTLSRFPPSRKNYYQRQPACYT